MSETIIIQKSSAISKLGKYIFIPTTFVGEIQNQTTRIKRLFDTEVFTKAEIEHLLLLHLGGEKMIKYMQNCEGVVGEASETNIYDNIAIVFEHYAKDKRYHSEPSRGSDLVLFVKKLSSNLKDYCDEYHRFRGLGQFEKEIIGKFLTSIINNFELPNRPYLLRKIREYRI